MRCALCAQCQYRRCVGHFDGKYLAGDMLKAKCGAEIRVEVRDRVTGDVVDDGTLSHIHLEARSLSCADALSTCRGPRIQLPSPTQRQQEPAMEAPTRGTFLKA